MQTAAIYARVSSDQQKEENTIASQTAALIDFAREQGYSVPDDWVIEDEGFSGASLLRPGLERLRDLAAEGHIQAVLIHSPDRLSRKYAYQVLLTEEFARHGVETIFLKAPHSDTPEDQLMLQFQGMIAEYERAQILERSRRGKRHRAKAGEVSVLGGVRPMATVTSARPARHRHGTRSMLPKPKSCGWSTTSIPWAA
jgi:site-specific DNA recombinase